MSEHDAMGPRLPPCVDPGEACDLRVFLWGGPEEWGTVGVLGPERLQTSSSTFSYPSSSPGVRAPDVGSALPFGEVIIMPETHSFIHSACIYRQELIQAGGTCRVDEDSHHLFSHGAYILVGLRGHSFQVCCTDRHQNRTVV